ncbi:MAG: hypothetical protein HOO96_33075 [Polyangiaceae bacterium]|nr:hypothetical protein [Polyangiaceae bacterium]
MRSSSLLLLLTSVIGACSSSTQPTVEPAPTEQATFYRLTLSSVTDAKGTHLEQYFGPVPLALQVQTIKQGSKVVLAQRGGTLALDSRLEQDVSTRFEGGAAVAFDLKSPMSVTGVTLREKELVTGRYAISDVTSLAVPLGGALAAGDELEASGKLATPEQDGAGTVKLRFRVKLDEAPAELLLPPGSFDGKYLYWQGLNPAFDKPLELEGPVQLRVAGGEPFDLDAKAGSIWEIPSPGATQRPGDGRPRQLIFPGGTDWSGQAVPPRTIDFTAVQVETKTSFDFTTATGVSVAAGAAVVADPDCEAGTCLVLRSGPPSADGVCRNAPQAVFGIADSAHNTTQIRMRALGFDAAVWERVKLEMPLEHGWVEVGSAPPSVGRTDYAYDSGWRDVQAFGPAHTFHFHLLGCQPGMKVLVQRATVE